MVKFAPVQLGNGNPPPLATPSSSHFFPKGLGNQIPSSTPRYEGEDKDHQPKRWTNPHEEASFVQLMVKEVHKGNKHKTFTKRAWENIEQGFYEITGKKNILPQLKSKYNTLKYSYTDFNKLLKEPGFSWNPTIGHAIASDADWEACMQTNKRARVFREKGFPLYNELGIIFGDPVAGSQNATPPTLCSLDSEVKCGTEDDSTKSSRSNSVKEIIDVEDPYATLSPLIDLTKSGMDPPAAAAAATTTTNPIVGSQLWKASDHIPLPYEDSKIDFSNSSHAEHQILPYDGEHQIPLPYAASKIDILNLSHDELKSLSTTDFSITSCVKCLESIQGIDSRTYVKAVKLFKDVDWREMFMAMSAERRRDWLASLE